MTETTRLQMLRQCEEVDRQLAKAHRNDPRLPWYCYTCQVWLDQPVGHEKHSIR